MKYPTPPPELAWCLGMNIDGLRPWEFWAMDSEEYDMIREIQSEYRNAVTETRDSLIPDQLDGLEP